jgi:hypothetical protein
MYVFEKVDNGQMRICEKIEEFYIRINNLKNEIRNAGHKNASINSINNWNSIANYISYN